MVTSYSIADPVAQRDREAENKRVKGFGFRVKSLSPHFLSLSLSFPICIITCLPGLVMKRTDACMCSLAKPKLSKSGGIYLLEKPRGEGRLCM